MVAFGNVCSTERGISNFYYLAISFCHSCWPLPNNLVYSSNLVGQPAVTIPPPTVATPVLAAGYANTTPAHQIQISAQQEALRKVHEEAKVDKFIVLFLFSWVSFWEWFFRQSNK